MRQQRFYHFGVQSQGPTPGLTYAEPRPLPSVLTCLLGARRRVCRLSTAGLGSGPASAVPPGGSLASHR